jgi:membrane protein
MPVSVIKNIKQRALTVWTLLKDTASEFLDDNAIKLSASLSFYTIFSLPPLLLVIISLSGIFFGKEAVRGEIFGQINNIVGDQSAIQIQNTIKHLTLHQDNFLTAAVGVITLIIGATSVFAEMQSSINFIWGIRPKPNRGLRMFLKNRLMSFSMLGAISFLFIVSLLINSLIAILYKNLKEIFPTEFLNAFYVLNYAIVFVTITLLFGVIFRTLPDGRVSFRDTFVASAVTAILFMIGKFAITYYLSHSKVVSAYGAAGSIILILLWVYYSAIILYLGAEFTKVYTRYHQRHIIPNRYAVILNKTIIEKEPKVLAKK